jgi:putative ABC transport system ATP-binding protein
MSAHLELRGITKVYRREQTSVPVLHGIDLSIDRGERISIMGRSGSGKSTLLNVLGCLDAPSSGQYLLDGVDVAKLPDAELSALRNRSFGFVFQAFHLLKSFSVLENVKLPMEYSRVPEREQKERALELLELVGLEHRLHHLPTELSGGERQRVAVARALVNRPAVVFADEPTGALDTRAQRTIVELFGAIHQRFGTTLVVVTHDPLVAEELGDRVIKITDGRVESGAFRETGT